MHKTIIKKKTKLCKNKWAIVHTKWKLSYNYNKLFVSIIIHTEDESKLHHIPYHPLCPHWMQANDSLIM